MLFCKEDTMQKFIADDSFWELFPHASIGIMVARGMKPASAIPPDDAAAIAKLLHLSLIHI